MSIINMMTELLYLPQQQCLLCTGSSNDVLCSSCAQQLNDYRKYPVCRRCGRFFPVRPAEKPGQAVFRRPDIFCKGICCQCSAEQSSLLFNRAAAPYDSVLQEPLKSLKYSGKRSIAEFLGMLMAEVFKGDRRYWQADCLLPVPLWSGKLMERGFNQAQLLAEIMAKELAISIEPELARRCSERQVQAKLNRGERQRNVSGVFAAGAEHCLAGRKIIIVDDTYTTGSTLNELARVLYEKGAAEVSGLTLLAARTECYN